MPVSFMVFMHGLVVLALLPLAVLSLATGSKPPENTFLTKYYRAEKHQMLAGNLFLLALSAAALASLAQLSGLVDGETASTLDLWIQVPFFVLLVVFLGFFVRAVRKVRGAGKAS